MKKTIEQHEEVNLHIKKSTVYAILRGLFVIPIGLYLMVSIWMPYSLFPEDNSFLGYFPWWMIGNMFSNLFSSGVIFYFACVAIFNEWLE
jgi:hypothetical protein